ncbi:DUF262 domain-containing protein [Avibacterium avium]|uniref:Uncharacterized conserved protein n=1 Tax=Avibacterium avium TaxID=751 RepID=A0A379AU04_AVIAV|nr:DUF262 domain-containing protein [Avibacterium avium]SUB24875.1 Uncharacterized conserved protein [Avibacterium avium]
MSNKENRVYYGEYSLKHWVDLILSKNIVLPPYQRRFVWDLNKMANFIKSLNEGYFIPPVVIGSFCTEDGEKQNIILDGQQRLTSILLLYLGLFPNKDNTSKMDDNSYSDDLEYKENDENMLDWRFDSLTKLGNSKKTIKNEIKKNHKEKYEELFSTLKSKLKPKEFEELESIVNELEEDKSDIPFFDKNYLGFSFIVPDNSTKESQQKYYSAIFREINIGGQALLPQESRESFYYIDKKIEGVFNPKFLNGYKIRLNNGQNPKIDFIRYLSMINQYVEEDKFDDIAKGYRNKLENYYMDFIYKILNAENNDGFINNIKKGLGILENIVKLVWSKNRKFDSIIELDLYLFGLVYYCVMNHKTLNSEEHIYDEINKKVDDKYDEIKKDEKHTKAPNQLGHLRNRIKESINILGEFFNAPA